MDKESGNDARAAADATLATPFATIQGAVDAAPDGSTILVEPGVYDTGNGDPPGNGGWGFSRVGWANRKLILKSTRGPSVTHIVGAHSSDTELGIGEGAVRCLAFRSQDGAGAGSVVEGFTLRDGATVDSGSGGYKAYGGAFYSNTKDFHVVGCVISNCVAYQAGAFANGTLHRCLVSFNAVRSGNYLVSGSAKSSARIYSSVIVGNSTAANGIMLYNADLVGCTAVSNKFGSCTYNATGDAYNSVFLQTGLLHASYGYHNCVTSGRPVMSPLFDDWRAVAGGSAATAGEASHVALMALPDGYAAKDYYGRDLPAEGTIAAGASAFPVTPAGGGICSQATSGLQIDGRPVFAAAALNYVYPETYPTQYHFTAYVPSGSRVCRYNFEKLSALVDATATRFPDMDDGLWVMPPPQGYVLTNNSVTLASKVIWVKPDADAATATGGRETPFRTLKAAVAAYADNCVICCMAGVYAEDSETTSRGASRVKLPADRCVRIVSETGAADTFICGAPDVSGDADALGCGPAAVRCVEGNGVQQVQGFTLTGGRTTVTEYGGAVRSGGTDLFLSDCVITNNAAHEAAAVYGARLQRCYVGGNAAGGNFAVSYAPMSGCVVVSNTVADAAAHGYAGYSSPAYNTTFALPRTHSPSFTWVSSSPLYNCIVFCGNQVPAKIPTSGTVYWNVTTLAPTGDYVTADPYLADAAGGDLRPFACSPAFTAPVHPTSSNYGAAYWFWAATDYDGTPLARLNGGRPFAGAFGTPSDRHAVIVAAASGGLDLAAGVHGVATDATTRIAAVRGSRPCVGVSVGGDERLFEDAQDHMIDIAYADTAGGAFVQAVYTNVWYASPAGDDGAAGSYPDAALTLSGALSAAVGGDRVRALPGEYAVGEMRQNASCEIAARAVVPEGVTLESTSGAAATVIRGRAATVPDEPPTAGWDVRGMGADAVRCVFLNSGSTVKGFTLTDGFTRVKVGGTEISHVSADTTGGGVKAMSGISVPAWVSDCVITNCAAYRGGGAMNVSVLRCVFVDNSSMYFGSAASDCACYESLTRANVCPNGVVNAGFSYCSRIDGCTALDALGGVSSASGVIVNTLVKGYFSAGSAPVANIRNCVINRQKRLNPSEAALADAPMTIVADESEIALLDSGRPVIGSNPAVDAGDASQAEHQGDADLSGMQRVYNGVRDIGALEADWRPRYTAEISSSGWLAVSNASPGVVESPGGRVRLDPGASLEAVWRAASADGRLARTVAVRVVGGGTLTLFSNGVPAGVATESSGETRLRFCNSDLANHLVFSYAGDDGYAEIVRAYLGSGMCVILQ